MILLILICTLIGYLVGHAMIGLGVGLVFWALVIWVEWPNQPRGLRRRR